MKITNFLQQIGAQKQMQLVPNDKGELPKEGKEAIDPNAKPAARAAKIEKKIEEAEEKKDKVAQKVDKTLEKIGNNKILNEITEGASVQVFGDALGAIPKFVGVDKAKEALNAFGEIITGNEIRLNKPVGVVETSVVYNRGENKDLGLELGKKFGEDNKYSITGGPLFDLEKGDDGKRNAGAGFTLKTPRKEDVLKKLDMPATMITGKITGEEITIGTKFLGKDKGATGNRKGYGGFDIGLKDGKFEFGIGGGVMLDQSLNSKDIIEKAQKRLEEGQKKLKEDAEKLEKRKEKLDKKTSGKTSAVDDLPTLDGVSGGADSDHTSKVASATTGLSDKKALETIQEKTETQIS